MNIRAREDELFQAWRRKYADASFVIDGCPNPFVYEKQDRKIVFVLKDGNLGTPDPSESIDERTYNQRDELEKQPTPWWRTLALWSFFLENPSATWQMGENSVSDQQSIRDALSRHCIVQLKKTWGIGSVKKNVLQNTANTDKDEITKQLSIYTPNFIVCCGNGDHLAEILCCRNSGYRKTSDGIGYWKAMLKNGSAFLVDYCHPSIRVGTKVKGIVAKGLISAITEIESKEH